MAEAHVVRDFRIGNTRIRIADNYCRRAEAEIEHILLEIADRAKHHLIAAELMETDAEREERDEN